MSVEKSPRRARSPRRSALTCLLVVLAPSAARAEPSGEDKAFAEALFRDGREAMAGDRLDEACPKFAESQRLDPALGTLLNLAVCHERQGRVASAWGEFTDALAQAEHEQSQERAAFAREHARAVEARLSYLAVDVASPRPDNLEVLLDGRVLKEASWQLPLPADPGKHTVTARAPGIPPWQEDVEVPAGHTTVRLQVPRLQVTAPPAAPPTVVIPPPAPAPASGRAAVVLGVGGAGVAGVAVGAVLGSLAIHEKSLRSSVCDAQNVCTSQSGVDADHAARNDATGSTVAFAVGGAGLVAAGLLYALWPSRSSTSSSGATSPLRPWVGQNGGGVDLRVWW